MNRLTETFTTANLETYLDFANDLLYPSLRIRMFKKLFYAFCKILFKIYCPLTVIGRENLPSSPFIFCSNHCSHMDSIVLMLASQLPFSRFVMLAAKDYFFEKNKFKLSTHLMNLIPVDRKSTPRALMQNLLLCKTLSLKEKRNLIIYPEGTRSLTGEMASFKRGPAMFSLTLGIPIVPVHIQGTYHAMPKGSIFPKPKRIKVIIGKPLYPNYFKETIQAGKQTTKIYNLLTSELKTKIHALKFSGLDKLACL